MSQEEIKLIKKFEMRKEAGQYPVTTAPSGTRAPGETCAEAITYGSINGPSVSGSIVSYGEAWYSFTGTENMTVTASLCASGYDTKLEIWYDCGDATYAFYNDDACGTQSEIGGIPFTAGATYYAKVYGYSSSSGNYTLEITGVVQAPAITSFPYSADFEDGMMPTEFGVTTGSGSDVFISADAANNSNYGILFEGNTSTGWGSTPYSYAAAFDVSKSSHFGTIDILVEPDGSLGNLTMFFDLMQGYSFNANYSWFRTLIDGNPLYDVNGDNYWQPSTHTDPFQTLVVRTNKADNYAVFPSNQE
jgi:hypothetical protein